ncbi:MAG TPA: HD domain-containing phosphohydrolase [Terriglobales bacterium]
MPESAGTQVIMTEQVLLVDDEPAVLDGYRRLLGRSFQLETAEGAVEALARFQAGSSYAVVVSDMRMPEMNGVQFLTKVRSLCPDTVRIMLTGNADIETAVHAVNDGNIFRFLTKPCTKELISTTLMAAIEQYHLIVSEKELLENTLRGSIRVLTEVLSLVNPAAFSRSMRVRRYVQQIATFLRLEKSWQFDVAAMMSQLGCVTLDPETVDAMYANSKLAPEEQSRYDQHPAVAAELLNKIPRMEAIAWMIAHQNNPSAELPNTPEARVMRTGAEILGAALAFDEALNKGVSKDDALSQVHTRFRQLNPEILHALRGLDLDSGRTEIRDCPISELSARMVLTQEVRTQSGLLIVAAGQEVTPPLVLRLRNFYEKGAIPGHVVVKVPLAEEGARVEKASTTAENLAAK